MALNNYEISYHTNHDLQNESVISVRAHSLQKALIIAEKQIRAVRRPTSIHFWKYTSYDSKRKKLSDGFCLKNV